MKIKILFGVEEVIRIHDDILENTGGEFGILNKGMIEFTVERTKGEIIREDIDIFTVSSIILRDFVQGHPFIDGNKRVAFELVDILLRENGYKFNVVKDEIIRFLLGLAKRQIRLKEVEKWVRKNVKLR